MLAAVMDMWGRGQPRAAGRGPRGRPGRGAVNTDVLHAAGTEGGGWAGSAQRTLGLQLNNVPCAAGAPKLQQRLLNCFPSFFWPFPFKLNLVDRTVGFVCIQ